jgi:hypothetical protein
MSAAPSRIEIHVHGIDGQVSRFVQSKPEAAQKLLDHIHPNKVFEQRHLMIASAHSFAMFPCASIAQIDLVMDSSPDWPFHNAISDSLQITAEEFQQRYRAEKASPDRPLTHGAPVIVYADIELANGSHLYNEVHTHVEQRLPVEQAIFLQQLLSVPSLYTRRRGGGAVLINPIHVVRVTFYPGPQSTPPNALPAEPLGL